MKTVVQLKGIPKIIRMDRGTENNTLADIQTLLGSRPDDSVPCTMFGSSNHNQRIERFWGTLRKVLLQIYMDLFGDLELAGLLDMSNQTELECLAFCFLNVIRKDLYMQSCIWDTHRIRAMKGSLLPSGIPQFLYDYPACHGYEDQLRPIDITTLEADQSFCQIKNYTVPDHDLDFEEWALQIMLDNNWQLPNNRNSALTLFGQLLAKLRSREAIN